MKTRPIYIQVPENEYLRLKIHALCHNRSIQMVIRNALSEYLSANKIKDQIIQSNEDVDHHKQG